uniref:DNA/RNA-binding protein Alba-like domain-containing protein n=1 Tax=Gadus morhua TaxID=8049 RepID=A0A8C5A3Z4_GADMO
MENYRKASTEEDPARCPFLHLPAGTPQVLVKDGSKIRNIVGFALSRGDRPPEGGTTAGVPIVFTATGKGISKAITCAEMVKRRLRGGGGVHQRTELQYRAVRELWEPLEPGAGLDGLTVSRNVPALWILLSRDPLEPPGPADQNNLGTNLPSSHLGYRCLN